MWQITFEQEFDKRPPANQEEIELFQKTWNVPLSQTEVKEITAMHKKLFPADDPRYRHYVPMDPAKWSFPQKVLPPSYLQFLQYSNGGEFSQGDRYFQFFSTDDHREMNVAYEFPEYMPGVSSFAMDG